MVPAQDRCPRVGGFSTGIPVGVQTCRGQTAAPTGLAAQARNQHRSLWGPLASRLPHFLDSRQFLESAAST